MPHLILSNWKLHRLLSSQSRSPDFHRGSGSKTFLKTLIVVEVDILINRDTKFSLIAELGQVVHFRFHDAPEPLGGAVIDAMAKNWNTFPVYWKPRSL